MGRQPSGRGPGRPAHSEPGEGQVTLDGLADGADVEVYRGPLGLVAQATRSSIARALTLGMVDPDLDAAVGVLAVELGRALDAASAGRDAYAVATVSRELRGILADLGLTPAARSETGAAGDLEQFLADLGNAEVCDPPDA